MSCRSAGDLSGALVVNTRPRFDNGELTELLMLRGADVIEFPTIELTPREPALLKDYLSNLPPEDLLVFTSANSLRFLQESLETRKSQGPIRVTAIGQKTAKVARTCGLEVIFEGRGEESGQFAKELISFLDTLNFVGKLILLRGSSASDDLPQRLLQAKIPFQQFYVYDSMPVAEGEQRAAALCAKLFCSGQEQSDNEIRPPACLVFSSSLGAENFIHFVPAQYRSRVLECPAFVIGSKTARACQTLGFAKVHVPVSPSSVSIVDLMVEQRLANASQT